MLHLFRDRLEVAFAADRLTISHASPGLRARTAYTHLDVPAAAAGAPSWQAALTVLRAYMHKHKRPCELTVVVSNAFARYQLLPAQPAIEGFAEEEAFVRFKFREAYGDAADSWLFSWGPGLNSEPQPVAAIDRALLDGLEALCAESGSRLASVQPYLMALFNRVGRNDLDVVVYEGGRVCALSMRRGSCQQVVMSKMADWANELPLYITRYSLMIGNKENLPAMLLCLPSRLDVKSLPVEGNVTQLIATPDALVRGAINRNWHKGAKL